MASRRNNPRSQPSDQPRESRSHNGEDDSQDNDDDPYRYHHPYDQSIGNDSSTAMSLDESSIHPLNASISSTPAARSRAIWPTSDSNKKSSRFTAAAASSPVFSPTSDGGASMDLSSTPTIASSTTPAGSKTPARMRDIRLFSSPNLKNDTAMPDEPNEKEPVAAIGRNSNSMPANRPPDPLNMNANNPTRDQNGSNFTSNQSTGTNTTNITTQSREWTFSPTWNIEIARVQLRRASIECRRRGLPLASRWASEQLMGLAPPNERSKRSQRNDNDEDNNQRQSEKFFAEETCEPNDVEIYALSLFDLGEYSRAAYVLSSGGGSLPLDMTSTVNSSSHLAAATGSLTESTNHSFSQIHPPRHDLTPLGRYLRAYSLYLEGERKKEETVTELRDPLERTSVQNAHLPTLEAELRRMSVRGELDAFGLYVYGVVLKGLRGTRRGPVGKRTAASLGVNGNDSSGDTAQAIFIRSILMYPYNWSAWLDLAELCSEDPSIDREVEQSLSSISGHWMYHFFCVHVFIENRANENAIAIIEKLANGNLNATAEAASEGFEDGGHFDDANVNGFFVQSSYLQSQLAMAYYDVRDYDSAHEHFLALAEREPYRLDHMDAFSNVLYVKDQKVALSHLAHRSIAIDKYRPETCIIVGNYYSSKARHEKAVQYFQRALKLDRTYLSAWTLLGHEYIEMKNTAAAIEAYRRAVDISEREYRAWYGLGQTYEILNMLLHALFYFRKAAALHPHDSRMWCAIGGCLLGLDRRNDAEKSYERAVSLGDGEGIATRKLAELYREDGEEEKAAKCFLRHLELRYQAQETGVVGNKASSSPDAFETVIRNVRVDEPEAEALLYLANYYRDNLEYDAAILCATRLEDYPGPEKEQGKGLLRDIRLRMDQKAGERRYGALQSPVTSAAGSLLARRGRGGFNLSMESSSPAANAESSFEFSP